MKPRDQSLDLLRFLAILLVMVHHYYYHRVLTMAGWAGVDLFFVLSGFLISGLLFQEYKRTGAVDAKRFLIRRAFKIYPSFWVALGIYVVYLHAKGFGVSGKKLLIELLFVQNYFQGIMGLSWTLAVEEHFYLLTILVVALMVRRGTITRKNRFPLLVISVLVICLALRIVTYYNTTDFKQGRIFFLTHLRIDSLAFGTLVAYYFHFHRPRFEAFVKKFAMPFSILSVPMLIWPFFFPHYLLFAYTAGLCGLYLGVGWMVSVLVVYEPKLPWVLRPLAIAGRYSYTIYLIHILIGPAAANFVRVHFVPDAPRLFYGIVSMLANIFAGILMAFIVERSFLKIRDRYFPSRTLRRV